MRRTTLLLLAALGLVLGVTAPASAIMNGQPDSEHPYVALIFTDTAFCSASAISPTVLVTAGHCLEMGKPIYVSFDQRPAQSPVDGWPVTDAPGVVTGTGYPINDYCLANGTPCAPGNKGFTSQSDVAVVVLDTPVNLPRYAQLPDAGLVATLPKGQQMTESGYGVNFRSNGTGTGHPYLQTNVDRHMTTTILQAAAASSDLYLRQQPTRSHTQTCFGDSGGPTLLDGSDTLLGVHSFLNNPNCQGGPTSSARLDLPEVLAAIRSFE